jgi:hypothetical protein
MPILGVKTRIVMPGLTRVGNWPHGLGAGVVGIGGSVVGIVGVFVKLGVHDGVTEAVNVNVESRGIGELGLLALLPLVGSKCSGLVKLNGPARQRIARLAS